MSDNHSKMDHLYAVLFRESKIIVSKYEDYLKEKISSKELAQKMLSLRDAIKRIEELK
jgi:hypothetical protein